MNPIRIVLPMIALLIPSIGSSAELPAIDAPLSGIIWACGSEQRMGRNTEKWMEGINRNLQENPYVSGILIAAHWDIVNPEKGTYNWVNTDRLVALAKKHNKTFKLKIQSGSTTPDWVYEMGAKEFQTKVMNKHRSTFGETVRIPLPWDEIYLKEFKGFLGQVAVRYGKEENFKGIVLSGGNFNSSEMHLPHKSPGDMAQWASHGDYKQKIVDAYKEMMKYYVETFPGKQIFLHVSGIVGGMSPEVGEIVRYGVENYPGTLTLQNCQLNGKWNNKEMLSYSLVVQNNQKVHVGFQSVAKLDGARMGSVENSVFNYCQGKGEYWEVWQGDGSDIDICRRIDASIKECNKIGLQAYRDAHCKNFRDAPPRKSNKQQPWSAGFEGIYTHTATVAGMDDKITGIESCLRANPHISGVAIKIRWNQLHPERGTFHLDKLETLIATISKHGKKVHLVVVPGLHTPEWVFMEGAVKAGPFKIGKNDPSYSSLPWDPVFMKIWEKELRVIAGKYANDPRVAAIGVMGHNFKGEEMHAPKVSDIEEYGWSREVVLQNWKHWIDTYAELFPKKKLILTVSQMYKQDNDSPLPEQVAAYFVETIGPNAILQTDQLDGRSDAMKVSSAVCRKYASSIPHGHEMVGSFKEQPERQGSAEMTLYNAACIGNLRYLQLWRRDCDDPQYAKTLLELYEKYKTMPVDGIKQDLQRIGVFKEEAAGEK